jgi:hypothetical protein
VQPLSDAAAAARQGKNARSIGVISLFGETQDAIWSLERRRTRYGAWRDAGRDMEPE